MPEQFTAGEPITLTVNFKAVFNNTRDIDPATAAIVQVSIRSDGCTETAASQYEQCAPDYQSNDCTCVSGWSTMVQWAGH